MRLNAFLRDTRGVAAIELALTAPILIVGALGMADLARLAYLKFSETYAVGVGAQYVVANPGADVSALNTSISNTATPVPQFSMAARGPYPGCPTAAGVEDPQGSTCALTGAAPGSYVTVTATGPFVPIFTPPIVSYPRTVTTQAVVRTK